MHSETQVVAKSRLGEKHSIEIFFYSYDLQKCTTEVLSTFEVQDDGTFLLPNLDTLDMNLDCDGREDGIQGSILAMVKARYYADNASSIRHLTLSNVPRSVTHQYEMEKYVPSYGSIVQNQLPRLAHGL